MDKRAKVGYVMTVDDALKFWTRCKEAEEALRDKLTREEREALLVSLQLGEELSVEDLQEMMKNKKTLIVRDQNADSL